MGNLPTWLINWVVTELMKLITPEAIKAAEDAAKAFVVCELKKFAASTSTTIDDEVVQKIAEALGVPCP